MGQKYVYNPLTCEYDIINEGAPGVPGPRGPVGATGPAGAPGQDGEGVAPGGTTGQVLAKASSDDYDTEWVDQSGGGGATPTLEAVLNEGNTVVDNYLRLFAAPYDPEQTRSVLSAGQLQLNGPGGGSFRRNMITQDSVQIINNHPSEGGSVGMAIHNGEGRLWASNIGGGNVLLTLDGSNSESDSTLYLPAVLSSGVPETLATQEWVQNNAGGTPSLQDVVDVGDTVVDKAIWVRNEADTTRAYITDEYFQVEDSTTFETATIYPSSISLGNRVGSTGWLLAGYGTSEDGPGVQFTLDSANTYLEMEPQSTGGTLYLPEASTPETIATREWVAQSGTTTNRPGPVVTGTMYFDTSLGHPIWYDGAQWVDATGTGV